MIFKSSTGDGLEAILISLCLWLGGSYERWLPPLSTAILPPPWSPPSSTSSLLEMNKIKELSPVLPCCRWAWVADPDYDGAFLSIPASSSSSHGFSCPSSNRDSLNR